MISLLTQTIDFIDLKTQYLRFKPDIRDAIDRVLEHGRFIMGPEVTELENTLAAYVGSRHAITVASGTDSLEIALRALEIGPGDEVITVPSLGSARRKSLPKSVPTPCSWISTHWISTSLLIRSNRRSRPLRKRSCRSACSGRCQITMPSTRSQKSTASPVIEDAAQSFGATRHGVKSCNAARGAGASFPAKPLGCYGEGGALYERRRSSQ
jgi:UDP-2-acetamido-2-deoxy-ribo-hexuluronate aminotransferase